MPTGIWLANSALLWERALRPRRNQEATLITMATAKWPSTSTSRGLILLKKSIIVIVRVLQRGADHVGLRQPYIKKSRTQPLPASKSDALCCAASANDQSYHYFFRLVIVFQEAPGSRNATPGMNSILVSVADLE